jgi:hypothetical protein
MYGRNLTQPGMATSFMALHVAADRKGLAAPAIRALVWLLSSVRVRVNSQRARP